MQMDLQSVCLLSSVDRKHKPFTTQMNHHQCIELKVMVLPQVHLQIKFLRERLTKRASTNRAKFKGQSCIISFFNWLINTSLDSIQWHCANKQTEEMWIYKRCVYAKLHRISEENILCLQTVISLFLNTKCWLSENSNKLLTTFFWHVIFSVFLSG